MVFPRTSAWVLLGREECVFGRHGTGLRESLFAPRPQWLPEFRLAGFCNAPFQVVFLVDHETLWEIKAMRECKEIYTQSISLNVSDFFFYFKDEILFGWHSRQIQLLIISLCNQQLQSEFQHSISKCLKKNCRMQDVFSWTILSTQQKVLPLLRIFNVC